VLVSVALLGGAYLLLRDSSFVAVRQVRIVGVHGAQAQAIDSALRSAALHMSTLDVNTAALRAAVAPFTLVSGLRAEGSFPHGLRIEVSEQQVVAALLVNGARTAVAADGVILGPGLLSSALPVLAVWV